MTVMELRSIRRRGGMRKQFLAGVGAVAIATVLSGPVTAADRKPVYKAPPPPPPAPICTWCGFYFGGHIGAAWAKLDGFGSSAHPFGHPGLRGLDLGIHAGYNWQSGPWVFGLEGDISHIGGAHRRYFNPALNSADVQTSIDWLASIRGRLGVAFDPVLIYATGGVAWPHANATFTSSDGGKTAAPLRFTSAGGVVGGGVEWKFNPNLSLRLEGLHYIFNHNGQSAFACCIIPPTIQGTLHNVTVARAGLTWYFGGQGFWGKGKAPIVARY